MGKDYLGIFYWILGAIIWAVMAWTYYSEGRVGFASIQILLAVISIIKAVINLVKLKKK